MPLDFWRSIFERVHLLARRSNRTFEALKRLNQCLRIFLDVWSAAEHFNPEEFIGAGAPDVLSKAEALRLILSNASRDAASLGLLSLRAPKVFQRRRAN